MDNTSTNTTPEKKSFFALTPLILFLLMYLGTSLILNDFYKVPITVAFLVSSLYAIAITKGISLKKRIELFSQGAGNKTLLLMVWIFILAGAFAQSAKDMGAVEATVSATLKVLPESFLFPGLFLSACFISLSIGTSVGTIAALVPMAVGISDQTGVSLPLVVAIVVGGSFFGDNLSFISDTTIIATKSQDCLMKDKFKVNSYIVIPAALIMMICYYFLGRDVSFHSEIGTGTIDIIKIIPYLSVLICAIIGMDVMIVLTIGIILTGVIGITSGSFDLFGWFASMGEGIKGMSELIMVTLLAGGMLELLKYNGALTYLTEKLTAKVKGKRGGELCVAAMVMLSDICTANNTITIITVGPIAKEISNQYKIDKRKVASLLDTFSCFAQGLIPYGAQLLIAAGLSSISPGEIFKYLYYPMLMGVVALVSILLRYPRKYS